MPLVHYTVSHSTGHNAAAVLPVWVFVRPKYLIVELETPEVGGARTQEPIVSVFVSHDGGRNAFRRGLSGKSVLRRFNLRVKE